MHPKSIAPIWNLEANRFMATDFERKMSSAYAENKTGMVTSVLPHADIFDTKLPHINRTYTIERRLLLSMLFDLSKVLEQLALDGFIDSHKWNYVNLHFVAIIIVKLYIHIFICRKSCWLHFNDEARRTVSQLKSHLLTICKQWAKKTRISRKIG